MALPEPIVEGLPDAVCHQPGWDYRFIDGSWRVGMAGNLDTRHDARITIHRHYDDPHDDSEQVAKWIADKYNAARKGR